MADPASQRDRRRRAIAGSVLFLVVAPGVVAGLIPALIAGWDVDDEWLIALRLLGAGAAAGGVAVLLHAFARFAFEGLGTPAPVAPTERLVVGGLYRRVRNPMYLAVLTVIGGQALWFGSAGLLAYGALVALAFVTFVRGYEEPTLAARYGEDYSRYRAEVPGWMPRLSRSPARPGSGTGRGPSGSGGTTR